MTSADEERVLRNAVCTIRSIAVLLPNDSCARLISLMNETLYSVHEAKDSLKALEKLKSAHETMEMSAEPSCLEPLILNFTQVFLVVIRNQLTTIRSDDAQKASPSTLPVARTNEELPGPSIIKTKEHQIWVPPVDTAVVTSSTRDEKEEKPGAFIESEVIKEEEVEAMEEEEQEEEESPPRYRPGRTALKRMAPATSPSPSPSSRTYDSPVCNFDTRTGLLLVCPFCPYVFTNDNTNKKISAHIERWHTDIRGTFFECRACAQNFITSKHEAVCPGQVVFNYNPDLGDDRRRNKRTSCLGLESDECPLCNEFLGSGRGEGISINALTVHVQKNHSDLPGTFFRCTTCPEYRTRGKKSMQRHHKNERCGGQVEYFYNRNPSLNK